MSPLEFGVPWALFLIPAAILLWVISRRSATGLPPRRSAFILMVRALILLCLVFALSDPRLFLPSSKKHVVWGVDVSESVGDSALNAARAFSEKSGVSPTDESWVLFAGRPDLGEGPGTGPLAAEAKTTFQTDATDLAAALQFSTAIFPSGKSRILALFSDGVETGGRASEHIAALQQAGVVVFTFPVPPKDDPEILVRAIEAPRMVRSKEPFELHVVIVSNRETEAELDVFHEGVLAGTKKLALTKGDNPVAITQRIATPGVANFRVVIRVPEDTRPENNSGPATVMVEGDGRILIVSEKPSPLLADALEPQGVVTETRPPQGIPTRAADLVSFDAVILDEVAADSLSTSQRSVLVSYVKDFGGGLLMLGGGKTFGPGGYGGTGVEELLPVRSEFQKQVEDPSLAIVPVIDSSGSMIGEKISMAASAAQAAINILTPLDYAGVIAFSGRARWVVELQSASNKATIASYLATLEAGGGTNIAAGLDLASESLRKSPAKIRHIILLSDGVSIPGPYAEIAARLVADKITLSTVGVGSDADAVLLDQLARWGNGRYYHTDSPENIPQIFARETVLAARPSIREEPFLAIPQRRAPFLEGIDFSSAPPLLGFVSTVLQPGADLWIATETGEPLLATWRTGLGKTAAFTSDARDVWASEWLTWENFGRFWAQVLREIQRGADLRSFPLVISKVNGGLDVSLDAVDTYGRGLENVEGELSIHDGEGEAKTVPLEPIGPGRLGIFLPTPHQGTVHLQATVKSASKTLASQYAGVSFAYPDEFLLRPMNLPLLTDLAEATGGTVSPAPADLLKALTPTQRSRTELWPWFVIAAIGLFILDVGLRRLPSKR
ncbi:MAG: VWA domain-containing protein [Terrimicrobiaceae bacterium]